MDLTDPLARATLIRRLGALYAGRPVVVGPGVLAGSTPLVRWLRALDCRVLVIATVRGAGPVPAPDECTVVELTPPRTTSTTDELRAHEQLARQLPAYAVRAIEAFDPERQAVWVTSPFVTIDEPILGRPVTGGRPAAFLALEDKLLAELIWAACDVVTAPHRVVRLDAAELDRASADLAGTMGAVWSGDARDGFNGGGNYVRWVVDAADRAAALSFFGERCDRVRVMPFLDGIPCSIHGFVLPDGTAAFRPVEISMLRNVAERRFVYGGLGTFWDPPADDREEMRAVARRVGEHLRSTYAYAGAFGVDGVLTADGFRPTELNSRMSAGANVIGEVDRQLFTLLQANLVAGVDTGVTVAGLESLVPLMDARRGGKPLAVAEGPKLGGHKSYPVAWDGTTLCRAGGATGNELVLADTPTGFFAKIEPCAALATGDRLAPLNAGLMAFLDREYAAGFGPLTAAPSLR